MEVDTPDFRPSKSEKAARKEAKAEELLTVQDRARAETENLFRLFGAAGAVDGRNVLIGSGGSRRTGPRNLVEGDPLGPAFSPWHGFFSGL